MKGHRRECRDVSRRLEEERWSKGDEDTEHLRTALQRYRQFFRLLLME
jgi:hypothetical protein